MRIFIETQRFNWWIFIVPGLLLTGMILFLTTDFLNWDKIIVILPAIAIVIMVILILSILRLHTRIDNYGIVVWFSPYDFSKKHFSWKEIEKCYIRRYTSKGIGFNSRKKHKAYRVRGKDGIQIVTKNNTHFLVGTQKPHDVKQVINYYKNRTE